MLTCNSVGLRLLLAALALEQSRCAETPGALSMPSLRSVGHQVMTSRHNHSGGVHSPLIGPLHAFIGLHGQMRLYPLAHRSFTDVLRALIANGLVTVAAQLSFKMTIAPWKPSNETAYMHQLYRPFSDMNASRFKQLYCADWEHVGCSVHWIDHAPYTPRRYDGNPLRMIAHQRVDILRTRLWADCHVVLLMRPDMCFSEPLQVVSMLNQLHHQHGHEVLHDWDHMIVMRSEDAGCFMDTVSYSSAQAFQNATAWLKHHYHYNGNKANHLYTLYFCRALCGMRIKPPRLAIQHLHRDFLLKRIAKTC